jgi:hypothetical protein
MWLSRIALTSYSSSPSTRVGDGGGAGGIRKHGGQLDHGEDGVKAAEVGRARWYTPWPTHSSMTKGPKCQWDSLDDGLLVAMLLPSNQTLSPGENTRAGLHWQF